MRTPTADMMIGMKPIRKNKLIYQSCSYIHAYSFDMIRLQKVDAEALLLPSVEA